MIHLGDITKIDGYKVPIVDCVVGGSPCQDLSVAGKRAGLDGERSGLFMEQLRVIKEMRENDKRNGRTDEHIRPRYMVWENVPGAFSSNKAEDFRIVLEETAKVKDPDAVIPMPDSGKWTTSGCILGDGWSIAWRVCDAQFYGVPQRRRRIALIADFGGHSSPEILFVRKSVSRDTESSESKGKEAATDATRGIGANDCLPNEPIMLQSNQNQAGICQNGICYTLTASMGMGGGYVPMITSPAYCDDSVGVDIYNTLLTGDKACPLTAGGNTSTGTSPKVMTIAAVVALDRASFNQGINAKYDFDINDSGVCSTIVAKGPSAVCYSTNHGTFHTNAEEGICATLQATDYKDPPTVYYKSNYLYMLPMGIAMQSSSGIGSAVTEKIPTMINGDNPGWQVGVCHAVDCRNGLENDVNGSLQSNMAHSLNGNNVIRTKYIVRRLTPLECERLQGYPDGWTDIGEWIDSKGKVHKTSDAARYKALGNSIALPPWKWVLKRLCACYERDATLASLFDGIGGFPLIWEQINGKGTCLWASEIEEFPIAVTKARIGE